MAVRGTTQERSVFFLANPDLAMYLAPGAAAMTSRSNITTGRPSGDYLPRGF